MLIFRNTPASKNNVTIHRLFIFTGLLVVGYQKYGCDTDLETHPLQHLYEVTKDIEYRNIILTQTYNAPPGFQLYLFNVHAVDSEKNIISKFNHVKRS